MSELIVTFVNYLSLALSLAIFGRVIMTWISPQGNHPVSTMLYQITEPILGPIRRVLPRMSMFDLSPLVALLILNYLVPRILQLLVP